MTRTIIIRRDYLHYIPKYSTFLYPGCASDDRSNLGADRYEKRHKNLAAHVSPAFRVEIGDTVTVGMSSCSGTHHLPSSLCYFQVNAGHCQRLFGSTFFVYRRIRPRRRHSASSEGLVVGFSSSHIADGYRLLGELRASARGWLGRSGGACNFSHGIFCSSTSCTMPHEINIITAVTSLCVRLPWDRLQ
jgi:ribosomal protein S17